MPDLTNNLGQLFVIGIPDAEPPPDYLEFIRRHQIGGVILFEHNCENYATASETIRRVKQQYRGSAPFIAVDQEGGRVCRLRGAPAEFKAPYDYGSADRLSQYAEDYSRAAVYLESLGFNLNFAPVADLQLSDQNTCLDGRCFATSPDKAIPFVQRTIQISHDSALLACAKHFPGLGGAAIDPHMETAIADYDLEAWRGREMRVFAAAVEADVDMIMTTHLLVPALDSTVATGSAVVTQSLLRSMLNFQGIIITDDLTMGGASVLGDYGERTIAAFEAGHDMLLFGKDFSAASEAFEQFRAAVERGDIDPEKLQHSLDRVASLKCKLARPAGHFI
jgi:beta-N-acetylhexosaminidase